MMANLLMDGNFESVARVVPRRSRAARDVPVVYRLPLLLPLVDPSDMVHCADVDGRRVYAWDGRLWSRMLATFASSASMSTVDVDMLRLVLDGRASVPKRKFAADVVAPDWVNCQTIEDDGLSAAEAAALEFSGGIAISGGIVYEAVRLPEVWLDVSHNSVGLTYQKFGHKHAGLFRFAWREVDEARRMAQVVATKIGVAVRDDIAGRCMVHRSDLVPDIGPCDAEEELRSLPERVGRDFNHTKTADIRRWLDVRTACDAGDPLALCLALQAFSYGLVERRAKCRDCSNLATEACLVTVAVALWCLYRMADVPTREAALGVAEGFTWSAEAA